MINLLNPLARNAELVIQELEDEILVFDTKKNKAHCLNQTASTIWKFCDGKNTVSEIKHLMEIRTGAKIDEDLIWLAVDQLIERDLLENDLPAKFAGENRREILKKIGLAAVVSLPIVASITAPTAAMAIACSGIVTSCVGCNGARCDFNMDGMIGMCAGGGCVND